MLTIITSLCLSLAHAVPPTDADSPPAEAAPPAPSASGAGDPTGVDTDDMPDVDDLLSEAPRVQPTPPEAPPAPVVQEPVAPAPAPRPHDALPPIVGAHNPDEVQPIEPARTLEEPDDKLHYEVYARGRYVTVPQGLMDVWFTGARDEGWPLANDRPAISAAGYGVQLDILNKKNGIAQFYVEFLQAFVDEGYWDDVENPNVWIDGNWLRPSNLLGGVIVGVNGAYDASIVRFNQTNGKFAMSFQFGGGLGIAAIVGSLDKWGMGTKDTPTGFTAKPAYERVRDGEEPDGKADTKSPVWPVPDLNFAFRFNIVDRFVFRLEGGLHGGLYAGGALGARF